MYIDVVRKGLKAMNGIYTSHKFSFVDIWHILCSKMFLKRLKAMNACLPMHGKWRTGSIDRRLHTVCMWLEDVKQLSSFI